MMGGSCQSAGQPLVSRALSTCMRKLSLINVIRISNSLNKKSEYYQIVPPLFFRRKCHGSGRPLSGDDRVIQDRLRAKRIAFYDLHDEMRLKAFD